MKVSNDLNDRPQGFVTICLVFYPWWFPWIVNPANSDKPLWKDDENVGIPSRDAGKNNKTNAVFVPHYVPCATINASSCKK